MAWTLASACPIFSLSVFRWHWCETHYFFPCNQLMKFHHVSELNLQLLISFKSFNIKVMNVASNWLLKLKEQIFSTVKKERKSVHTFKGNYSPQVVVDHQNLTPSNVMIIQIFGVSPSSHRTKKILPWSFPTRVETVRGGLQNIVLWSDCIHGGACLNMSTGTGAEATNTKLFPKGNN